jgi:hypothetical protein
MASAPTQYYMQENTQGYIQECEPVLSTRLRSAGQYQYTFSMASTQNLQNQPVIGRVYSVNCIAITKILCSVASWNFASMRIS